MATCGTWPDCVGGGRHCNDDCPPDLAGTDKTGMSVEDQDAITAPAWRRREAGEK